MSTPATASQTVGPYFSIGMSRMNSSSLCLATTPGEHIKVFGQVFDGNGQVVPDAQLELWQPDSQGKFIGLHSTGNGQPINDFFGFARVPTDEQGAFEFHTVIPGPVPLPDGTPQAPHIVVLLSMRGLLKQLFTRIYFAGNPANNKDPILLRIPEDRRCTVYARPQEGDLNSFLWNIHLQGENETVFFQY